LNSLHWRFTPHDLLASILGLVLDFVFIQDTFRYRLLRVTGFVVAVGLASSMLLYLAFGGEFLRLCCIAVFISFCFEPVTDFIAGKISWLHRGF